MSKSLDNTVEVSINLNSLTPIQERNDVGLSKQNMDMPAERFLLQQRCRAEANLIKARIAYKVHSNLDLSENEKRYLAQWMEAASQTNAILSTADILVPEEPCSLSLAEALTPEDFYMLNSLSRVSI